MKVQNKKSSLFLKGSSICITSLQNKTLQKNFSRCSLKRESFIFRMS